MISRMKHLTVVCIASDRNETLNGLRDAGCVHLEPAADGDITSTSSIKTQISSLESAVRLLEDSRKGKTPPPASCEGLPAEDDIKPASSEEFAAITATPPDIDTVLKLLDRRKNLIDKTQNLAKAVAEQSLLGDFDPELLEAVKNDGIEISLVKTPVAADPALFECDSYLQTGGDGRSKCYALVNMRKIPDNATVLPVPAERLSILEKRLSESRRRIQEWTAALGGIALKATGAIKTKISELSDKLSYEEASEALKNHGEVAAISGWMPEECEQKISNLAKTRKWGIFLRNPELGETPPTLIKPPKFFASITALFKGLGISPAYVEADVSVPFYSYFAIFFAMLVGDGGYGALIMALTALFAVKAKKSGKFKTLKPWFILMGVFSTATVAWGVLTNTWFGAQIPALQCLPSVRWLDTSIPESAGGDGSYHHIMQICFTLGASHLILARLWTAVCLFPDRTFLAQTGWAGVLLFMYTVTCSIVGIFQSVPEWVFIVFYVSLAFIFLFTLKGSELKSRGIELGMLPLNIMSALGDIISYVRLFAVGLASVKVAQNFNSMAVGLDMPVWIKIVPMILILIIGHALNFAMAALSILVHAVRLNTLEFSTHKGVSWSGYDFSPFGKQTTNKDKGE